MLGRPARDRKDLDLGRENLLQIECHGHEQVEAEGSVGSPQVLLLVEERWLEHCCTSNLPRIVGGPTRDRKDLELGQEDLLQIECLVREQVEVEESAGSPQVLFLVEEL